MLHLLKIDSHSPQVTRGAIQSVISSLNMSIITHAERHLRAEVLARSVTKEPGYTPYSEEEPGIDGFNNMKAVLGGESHEGTSRTLSIDGKETGETEAQDLLKVEAGMLVQEKPIKLAARLMAIRASLASELVRHAGTMINPLTDKTMINQYHLPQSIANTLDWRLKQEMPFNASEAMIKRVAELEDLEVSVVRAAIKKQHTNSLKFPQEHHDKLLELISNLRYEDDDGYDEKDTQALFNKLTPITQLRLIATAIKGFRATQMRAITQFIQGNPNALGDKELVLGKIAGCFEEIDLLMSDETFEREIDEAIARGVRFPDIGARPKKAEEVKPKGHIVRKDEIQAGAVA